MQQIQYPYYPVCKIIDPELIALNRKHWECVDRVRELDRVYVAVALTCLAQCLHADLIDTADIASLVHDVHIDFDNRVIHVRKSLAFDQLHPAVVKYLEQYRDSIDAFHVEKNKLRDFKHQLKAKLNENQYFSDQLFLDRNNTLLINIEGSLADYQKRIISENNHESV